MTCNLIQQEIPRHELSGGGFSSVSPIVQANTLIVTGAGFGTKPAQTPQIWETFDGEIDQLVEEYDNTWISYSGVGAIIKNLDARFTGHKAAYSDPDRGGDFLTNNKFFTPSESVFLSMWVRVHSYRENISGGATKFQRVNSSVASGGSGVYNGVGNCTLGGTSPPAWFASWSGSENGLNNLGYLTDGWYPLNEWRRIEYELKLNTLDVADGFHNVHVDRFGSLTSGPIMQRKTGFSADDYLWDSTLLGLESPNQWIYYIPTTLAADTDYRITFGGNDYVFNSETVPTVSDIVNGLAALLTAGSVTNRVWNNAELNVDGFNGATSTSANLIKAPAYGMSVSELFVDIDYKQFYVGDADTWETCTETNIQPFTAWSDTSVTLDLYFGGITGNKYLYNKLTVNTVPVLVGQLNFTGEAWEIVQ